MSCIATKEQGLKRTQHVSKGSLSPKPPATCYLTRGNLDNEWYIWNTAATALAVKRGDTLNGCLVSFSYDEATRRPLRVLEDFGIDGMGCVACVLEQEICFREPIGDPLLVATQVDLVDMCMSKGVKCAIFLEQHTRSPQDEELQLGSRVCSLCPHGKRDAQKKVRHYAPLPPIQTSSWSVLL